MTSAKAERLIAPLKEHQSEKRSKREQIHKALSWTDVVGTSPVDIVAHGVICFLGLLSEGE
jgi:hypothetical protein